VIVAEDEKVVSLFVEAVPRDLIVTDAKAVLAHL